MEATLKHGIVYEVTDDVAVEDLIKSLEANTRLLRETGKLLSEIIPGLEIDSGKVSVVYVSQQSPLREILALSVFVTYQDELEQEVPQLIQALTGEQIPDRYDTLVTVLVMLIAIYGISKAFDLLFPGRQKESLEENESRLLRRAAELTGATIVRVRDALETLFSGRSRRTLVTASQKIFAPSRNQSDAPIRTTTGEDLISGDAVRLAQSAAGIPFETEEDDLPQSYSEFYRNVRVILHAMDRDRKRTGWAGHVPSIFDDRIPMHLEKTQDPEKVFGKDEIIGDILLTWEENEEGEYYPKEFLLIQTYL